MLTPIKIKLLDRNQDMSLHHQSPIKIKVKEIKKKLKKSLDKQRYQHTLGVMYTAGCLAMANGYPIEKAMLVLNQDGKLEEF